jgi:Sec-independent protein secretion pathway component TatC
VQVAVAVIYCLFAAGIVFGYAALKPVLIKEGVYRNKCTEEELENGVRVCYEQEIRLNFMFTVAAYGLLSLRSL